MNYIAALTAKEAEDEGVTWIDELYISLLDANNKFAAHYE